MSLPTASNSRVSLCGCLAHRFGNAADHPDRIPCYGSDITEAEWQVVRAVLPLPAWLEGRGGWPEGYCHRVMLDAVRHVVDNGVKWANLPADFPPYRRVHAFARRRQVTGLLAELHNRLRGKVQEKEGRSPDRRPRSWTRNRCGRRRTSPARHPGGTAGRRRAAASGTSWWTASAWSWPCS
ncbi:transposase [Streptomyces inhibens]|uniref:Transposase n=1 Tax=Streptomyces inhibens TaxID=2293571 RepID=A0A371PP67_STRIH|nr:transposase [Streptomyces inhibens]